MRFVGIILIIICVLNIVVFFVVGALIGGDAINGKVENERYFLGDHGHYTEVSRAVYEYSRVHALSVFVTTAIPLIMSACGFWRRKQEGD